MAQDKNEKLNNLRLKCGLIQSVTEETSNLGESQESNKTADFTESEKDEYIKLKMLSTEIDQCDYLKTIANSCIFFVTLSVILVIAYLFWILYTIGEQL